MTQQEAAGGAGQRPHVAVVGASAGGVEALSKIAASLPEDFGAAVFVVLHLPEGGNSSLANILARTAKLPVAPGVDGAPIVRGTIIVAPPDRHLVLERDRVRLVRGPKVNGYRPAVDVLFHSAARSHGGHVVGVILSGTQSDGTLRLRAIKRRGGAVVVQADALHPGMPTSAMRNVEVDAAVPLREIANTLTMMVGTAKEAVVDDEEKVEDSALEAGFDIGELEEAPGDPTVFRCPECGGALWELEDGEFQAYVCHVGHSFSAESLLAQQGDGVERALWTAARLLEEQAGLQERLAQRMGARGLAKSKAQFENKASRASEAAEAVRSILQEAPEDEDGEAA